MLTVHQSVAVLVALSVVAIVVESLQVALAIAALALLLISLREKPR